MSSSEKQKKSGPEAPDLGVTPTSVPSRSNVMDLAASLICPGSGLEEARDQIVAIHVGRPDPMDHFRTHPTLHGDVNLLKFKVKGAASEEIYAVTPNMVPQMDNVKLYTLFYGVTLSGSSFLWPVSASSRDGYSRTARQIAIDAMKSWCRIVSDRPNSMYKKRVAKHYTEEPTWPEDKSFIELLALGFGDGGIIATEDHPMMKRMWLK